MISIWPFIEVLMRVLNIIAIITVIIRRVDVVVSVCRVRAQAVVAEVASRMVPGLWGALEANISHRWRCHGHTDYCYCHKQYDNHFC